LTMRARITHQTGQIVCPPKPMGHPCLFLSTFLTNEPGEFLAHENDELA
jgi:hypothetical protein